MSDALAARLNQLIAAENRRIIGEAVIAMLVGAATCILVYGGMFWIVYLALYFTRPFGLRQPALASLVITGVFMLFSVISAWRRVDPIDDVEAMDPAKQSLQMSLGYMAGVPVLNRQSIAGFASLFIGGPMNLIDGSTLFRSRIRCDASTIASAAGILSACRDGLPLSPALLPAAIGLLFRLGLIKAASHGSGAIELHLTAKGLEAQPVGTVPSRRH